jgi:hypothetical protein
MTPYEDGRSYDGRPVLSSFTQDVLHARVAARVAEDVGRGVFSNAILIVQANDLFAIDFLSTASQPQQIVSRALLSAATFGDLLSSLHANIGAYESRFGALPRRSGDSPSRPAAMRPSCDPADPPAPHYGGTCKAEGQPQPRIEDLYDELKLPDRVASGAFANLVLISHTAHEFALDFVCDLFPRAVVNARVFVPASRMRQFAETAESSFERYRQKIRATEPQSTSHPA